MKTRGFTLIEVLAVVAVIGLLTPVTARFFADGWTASRRAILRVENRQLLPIVLRQWRKAVHGTDAADWRADDRVFRTGRTTLRQEGRHICIEREGGERKALLLPLEARCRFFVEKGSGEVSRAVLVVRWPSRDFAGERWESARLVACAGQP